MSDQFLSPSPATGATPPAVRAPGDGDSGTTSLTQFISFALGDDGDESARAEPQVA